MAAAVLAAGGHDGACYDVTGPEAYSAADLAALYGELGGRPVVERRVSDAELVAAMVGGAGHDDHLRFGAELVASFGRSIREGYMSACTDHAATLMGRPAAFAAASARVPARGALAVMAAQQRWPSPEGCTRDLLLAIADRR